jgi:23S rRNA pseudouridine2605 synthase
MLMGASDVSADRAPAFSPATARLLPNAIVVAKSARMGVRTVPKAKIHDVRLNAYLARAGVASRRKADELIKAGRVRVNGEPGELNTFVGKGDVVELDDARLEPQPRAYVLLHKPAGVVTTAHDPQGRPTVVGLVEHEARVVPVGRLDADTTGALLLTNDGELAHRLAHPRYEVEKVYEADVEGEPDDEALARLAEGVELDDGRTAPARVRRLAPSRVELSIHEGRKHQVKRMLEAVGHPVRRLHRSRYAGLTLDGVEPGAWRELTEEEVAELRDLTRGPAD